MTKLKIQVGTHNLISEQVPFETKGFLILSFFKYNAGNSSKIIIIKEGDSLQFIPLKFTLRYQ